MDKTQIDDIICDIMINYGPDRHIDGHEIITNFIIAIREGNEWAWIEEYKEKVEKHKKEYEKFIKQMYGD